MLADSGAADVVRARITVVTIGIDLAFRWGMTLVIVFVTDLVNSTRTCAVHAHPILARLQTVAKQIIQTRCAVRKLSVCTESRHTLICRAAVLVIAVTVS